jgi:iron complex outermembrane receptor protein
MLAAGVACAAWLAWPAPAAADSRTEAKRHFLKGMEAIRVRDFAVGIRELKIAYDIKPHPSVLYNIARAYSDAGDLPTAVDYFDRYLATDPPDREKVAKVAAALKASLAGGAGAAPGPGAGAGPGTLVEPLPPPTSGPAAPATLPAGAATEVDARLRAMEERLDYMTRLLEAGARPGGPASRPAATGPEGLMGLEEKPEDLYDVVVVSASRAASSPLEAPAATTVITDEDIRLSGATNIPDILRRVPGMEALGMSASDTELSMRGFNQRLSNKLLVLVNGRSVYLDFLGGTFYRMLSISLEDIERIEVIRGPGSTLYGANAFGGVVNIITRPPGEARTEITLTAGMGDTLRGTFLFGGRSGPVGYRASVGYEQTDQWSLEFDPRRADYTPLAKDVDLALRATRFDGEVKWVASPDVRVGVSAGLTTAYQDFFAIGVFRDFWIDGFLGYVMADADLGPIKGRVFINHFDVTAGPQYYPTGTPDLRTTALADVVDGEAVFHQEFKLGIKHNLFIGGGYRLKTIDWTYLDDPHIEHHFKGFVEDRLQILSGAGGGPALDLTIGFRIDQHPLVGLTPSPRGAIVFRPAPGHAIRLSAGTAFRTPTFLESYLDLAVPSPVAAVSILARGNPELKPENIFQVDLGYTFAASDRLSAEVVGYYQRVKNLIRLGDPVLVGDPAFPAAKIGVVDPASGTFIAGISSFENSSSTFSGGGLELGVGLFPIDGVDIKASYAFEYMVDSETGDRDPGNPLHKINFGVQLRSSFGLDFNVDAHFVSKLNIPEREFNTETLDIERVDCRANEYVLLNARVGYRLIKDKLEIAVSGFNLLDPLLPNVEHREHCFANDFGMRAYGWVTYRF